MRVEPESGLKDARSPDFRASENASSPVSGKRRRKVLWFTVGCGPEQGEAYVDEEASGVLRVAGVRGDVPCGGVLGLDPQGLRHDQDDQHQCYSDHSKRYVRGADADNDSYHSLGHISLVKGSSYIILRKMPMNFLEDRDLSVGFVVSHPFYGSPGSLVRVKELSISLTKFGVKVHIYSPYPQEEYWGPNILFHKIPSIARKLGIQNKIYDLTRRVLNSRFFVQHILIKKKLLDRTINDFTENLIETVNDELDLIQGEQEIAAIACVRAREKLGIPVFSSLHNLWPEELVAMDLIDESSKEYLILQNIEQEIVSNSEKLVVVSEEMAKYIQNKYSADSDKILIIPPGGRSRVNGIKREYRPPWKVVYSGLVTSRANINLFIKSMPFVLEKNPYVNFYITRRGENLKRVQRLAKSLGVNPKYYWFPQSEDFFKFLSSCHVGVVPSSNDLPRKMGPAVKLFDYLSVGLPVVANNIGGWTRIVEKENVGILTEDDPKQFASAILKIIENKSLSLKYSYSALKCVMTICSWDNSAKTLLQNYKILS